MQIKFEKYEIRPYLMISCVKDVVKNELVLNIFHVRCLQIKIFSLKFHRVK
jgi:hypothetical protein